MNWVDTKVWHHLLSSVLWYHHTHKRKSHRTFAALLLGWFTHLVEVRCWKWSRYGKREDLLAGQGFLSVCFFKPNRNNYIEIETALELTKYLAEEDEILVWFEVLVNLINRSVISDVNNYAIYPLLKVISCFVMWLLNQPSLPLCSGQHLWVRPFQKQCSIYSRCLLIYFFLATTDYS